jgi:hypothetical protein
MNFRTCVAFLGLFFIPVTFAQDKSMSELGREILTTKYQELLIDLQSFTLETPWQETKKLRKDIGNFKLLLDTFVFVLDDKGLGGDDSWEKLRSDLDEGYEVYGNYKDLYDTAQTTEGEIDSEEKEELGELAMEWTEDYLKFESEKDVFQYLADTQVDFVKRKKKNLPKYLWKKTRSKPKKYLSGVDNLRLLISNLCWQGNEDLKELYDVKDLTDYESEETFHDWRKSLRNVLKLVSFFPKLNSFVNNDKLYLERLDLGIDKFGDINDLLVAYHKAEKEKEKKKLKKEIKREWKTLKLWLVSQEMDKGLIELSLSFGKDLI